ncbi:MAG: ABC transporter permease [Anaerolineae bacterium]
MKLLRDTYLILGSSIRSTLRNPIWMIFGMIQPALYLLLYAPLLNGMVPGGNALQVFTPGLLVMMGMTGSLFAGFGLLEDLRQGVIERLRVTPAHRLALLLGRVIRDVLMLLLQCLVLLLIAVLMGVRVELLGMLLTLLLVALIGGGLAALSYGLALVMKDENALASTVNTFMLPILLLSGIFLPMTFAPAILKTASI